MNFPISQSDFRVAMSDFSELLAIIKDNMANLENGMQFHVDNYLKKMLDIDNSKENIYIRETEKQVETWMYDLKNQLIHLEYCGRAAALKTFLYLNNYLHILRMPVKKSYDHTYKLPVYTIRFPENEKNEYRVVLKKLPTPKRKKLTKISSTCGGNNN
ncbi:uncharacterized protein LOC143266070 isoform X1 [Megachile rotundata]|uniref:uncharacterized protein LOC143266070 isoform X1 n=1 Tax=Megachile rotundata TaxID=143995 RepID=UPI003FD24D5C